MNGTSGKCAVRVSADSPSNEGRRVIRQDQVESAPLQRGEELALRLDARDLAGDAVGFERLVNQLRIGEIVFQVENAERRSFIAASAFSDAARRRLVDHRPKRAELLDRIDELVEIDRLHHVGVDTELVARPPCPSLRATT